jgi:WD40 repeat protein
VWSLAGELIRTLKGQGSQINTLASFDTDQNGGAVIASGCSDGNLRLWKHSTGEVLRYFNGHTEEISALFILDTAAELDGLIVVSGSKDKSVRTWLYAKEKSLRVIKHANQRKNSRINAISVYCEGDTVVIFTGNI